MIDGQDETRQRRSPLKCNPERAPGNNPGGFLLSHAVAREAHRPLKKLIS